MLTIRPNLKYKQLEIKFLRISYKAASFPPMKKTLPSNLKRLQLIGVSNNMFRKFLMIQFHSKVKFMMSNFNINALKATSLNALRTTLTPIHYPLTINDPMCQTHTPQTS